jgi:Fe-Mn family superoxide dismutase
MKKYELPKLPYALNALEPVISEEIMNLHYNKHHAAYVNNLNAALEKAANAELPESIALQSAIRFNGGGHINHSIFWTNLAPKDAGGGEAPQGDLAAEIKKKWGSLEKFIEEFSAETVAIQGSGWGWLGIHPKHKCLKITTAANQDPLVMTGFVPLLGIDVWEHAYYLQYKNVRADYVKAIWQIVNWKNVQERFEKVVG